MSYPKYCCDLACSEFRKIHSSQSYNCTLFPPTLKQINQSINTSFGFQANSSSHQSDLWPPHVQGLGLVWTPQKPSSPPTSSLCSQPNHGEQESLQFLYCLIWSSEFNLKFRAIPVDNKRPISALARLWKTLEVSQRKEERAKQAPILSPCRLLVFPTSYHIYIQLHSDCFMKPTCP